MEYLLTKNALFLITFPVESRNIWQCLPVNIFLIQYVVREANPFICFFFFQNISAVIISNELKLT